MLAEMRPSELGTWAAMYEIDPWTEERADLRAGIVASTIANATRVRWTENVTPVDFMPYAKSPKQQSITQRLKSFLKSRNTKAP